MTEGVRYWLEPGRLNKLFRFLGPRAARYLGLGVLTGLLLFCVELSFAFAVQAFLLSIGILDISRSQLPSWMPVSLVPVLGLIALIGSIRGILQWSQMYLVSLTEETQRQQQYFRILEWAFNSPSTSSSEAMTLFHSRTTAVLQAVGCLSSVSVLLPASGLLLCGLLRIAPVPTIAAGCALAMVALLTRSLDRKASELGGNFSKELSRINARMLLNIKNLLLMQIYGTQRLEERHVRESMKVASSYSLAHMRLAGLKFIIPQVSGVLIVCGITLVSVKTSGLMPSLLVTYFYLFVRFVQTFSEIIRSRALMAYYWPQVKLLAQWWAEHSYDGVRNPRPALGEVRLADPLPRPVGWRFRDVCFSYGSDTPPVFENLNLTVRPGETLVVTGPSGAGKSTLVGLALGLLKPGAGQVEALEEDGKTLPLSSLGDRILQSVGYVGPESFLVEGTLLENVTYGLRSQPSPAELEEALQLAECQFVQSMPKGLAHFVTDQGQGLSAGQKQRLALARALLRKPRILILDEATSNLDADTEAKLVETFRRFRGKVTILAVTHRQALLRIADQHLRLGEGETCAHPLKQPEFSAH